MCVGTEKWMLSVERRVLAISSSSVESESRSGSSWRTISSTKLDGNQPRASWQNPYHHPDSSWATTWIRSFSWKERAVVSSEW